MELCLKYKNISGTQVAVEDENNNEKYFIERKFWSKSWRILDRNGNELAKIKGREICIGDTVVAKVRQNFNLLNHKFELELLDWKVHSDGWSRNFSIFDTNGNNIAQVESTAFKMKPEYRFNLLDDKNELIIIATMLIIINQINLTIALAINTATIAAASATFAIK